MGREAKTITGQKFGSWLVLSRHENTKSGNATWLCRCGCGTERVVLGSTLRLKKSTNCGCKRRKHRMSKTVEWQAWQSMRARCNNKNAPNYKYYGGRGITVCKRWDDFKKFFKDMGPRPKGTSLDRINNEGNYKPSNCRWATKSEQGKNRRPWKRS